MTKMKEQMTEMTDFHSVYTAFEKQKIGTQRKIPADSCLEVYFGYSHDGLLRLSFMSKELAPKLESTGILRVVQGRESEHTYWTSFELTDDTLKEAYFGFCENMIDSIVGCRMEAEALGKLKRRYITWKDLFRNPKQKKISKEEMMGLFGELTVMRDIVIPNKGVDVAVNAWGGPDRQSKDFSVGDIWIEVKTVGANSDKVSISSLTQLDSENSGYLAVVRAEAVSGEYKGDSSSVADLIKEILLIIDSEKTERLFADKISRYGVEFLDDGLNERLIKKSTDFYQVSENFPRITPKTLGRTEIVSAVYSIDIASIARYKQEVCI